VFKVTLALASKWTIGIEEFALNKAIDELHRRNQENSNSQSS